MFLKSIHLKNVRCFDELELTFNHDDGSIRKWTILLGENGCGKSTLIKSIALVTAGSEAMSDLLTEPDEWVQYGKDFCEISAVLVTSELEDRQIKLRIERGDGRRDVIVRNSESLALLDGALEHTNRNYFVVGFGASRRLSPIESRQKSSSGFFDVRAQSVATLFDPDATLNPLESWAMDLDYFQDTTGIETVRRVLSSFLPSVKFKEIDKRRGQLLFETPDGVVSLRALSDGYQSAAAWVGDLLYRVMQVFEDYRSPLDARGLLLIDEVDLHLHPSWQQYLLSYIDSRLPNFQLVVTTHSPMTAQQAGPEQLHYVIRERGKIRIEQFAGDPRNLLLSQLLLTDAFGLESDESLEVQRQKERYTDLRDQQRRSADEESELESLSVDLSSRPEPRGENVIVEEEQLELLRRIQKELTEEKS